MCLSIIKIVITNNFSFIESNGWQIKNETKISIQKWFYINKAIKFRYMRDDYVKLFYYCFPNVHMIGTDVLNQYYIYTSIKNDIKVSRNIIKMYH